MTPARHTRADDAVWVGILATAAAMIAALCVLAALR